jgi:hypothetical protein
MFSRILLNFSSLVKASAICTSFGFMSALENTWGSAVEVKVAVVSSAPASS